MFLQRPQLLLHLLFFLHPPPISAVEEAFCASLRLAHFRIPNGDTSAANEPPSVGGPTSMGDQFWHDILFNSFWAANHAREHVKTNSDTPTMDIYAVRGKRADGTMDVLPGWLYLKLKRKDNKPIQIAAVWARSEWDKSSLGDSIGTFVDVDTECNAKIKKWDSVGNTDAKWLPPASIIPCAATPVFSPMNPNMAVYLALGKLTGGYEPRKEIHLLWKLDMSVCDSVIQRGFRFMVTIPPETYIDSAGRGKKVDLGKTHGRVIPDPKDNSKDFQFPEIGPYVFESPWFHVQHKVQQFYGAAPPIFDAEALSCGEDDLKVFGPDFVNHVDWITPKDEGIHTHGALHVAGEDFTGANQPDKYDDTTNPSLRWRCGPLPAAGQPPPADCPHTVDNPWPKENVDVIYKRQTCKPRLQLKTGTNTPERQYKAFWGRCDKEVKKGATEVPTPSEKNSPRCSYGSPAGSNWASYYQVLETERPGVLNRGCQCPPIPQLDDVKNAKARLGEFEDSTPYSVEGDGCQQVKSVKELDRLGLCKDSVAGRSATTVRLWHACTMLFTVMVVNSVSSYTARYLKGTLPVIPNSGRYRIPLTKWYVIHIALAIPTICMYLTCLSSMSKQTDILGYSLEPYAIYHRYIGWTIVGAFGFQMVSGFLRPLNVCCRRIYIFIHWACGEFVYHGAAVLCIMTYKIPSSPFSYLSHLDGNFNVIIYHTAPVIMMLWLAWDFLFHGYTMVYIIRYDRRQDVCRSFGQYFPVLISRVEPLRLRPEKHAAKRDRDLRRLAWGHAVMCVMMYALLVSVLKWWPNLDNHGFGVMECTHTHDGKFTLDAANTSYILHHKKFCPDF